MNEKDHDPVNHPSHYTSHPSGVECIQVTEHMGFCLGNAVKYLWRAYEKGTPIEDLNKAIWYIQREIEKRKKEMANMYVNQGNIKCSPNVGKSAAMSAIKEVLGNTKCRADELE